MVEVRRKADQGFCVVVLGDQTPDWVLGIKEARKCGIDDGVRKRGIVKLEVALPERNPGRLVTRLNIADRKGH